MQNSLITVLPPIIVLVLAFITHRILFSLCIGIITGTLIANDFAIIPAIKNAINTVWNTTQLGQVTSIKSFFNSNNMMFFVFLLVLGSIITLMTYSGGATAYRNFVRKKIKTKKGAQASSLILSCFFFLDDYFGCVTVGSVMHPLTDKFKIAKTKIAFLVNSMAPTLAIIIPISSWSAAIVMNISNAGVSDILKTKPLIIADPFYLYLAVIPFIFYSFIMISSTWFIVSKDISFGLMKKHEAIATKTGNLFAGKKPIVQNTKTSKSSKQKMIDFLLPISLVISSIFLLILYTGNYHLLGGTNNFVTAIKTGNPVAALLVGSTFTLIVSLLFFILKKTIKIKDVSHILSGGVKLLGSSIILLILAWSFTDILNLQLMTGHYLASVFIKYVSIKLLPLLFFFITSLTAVAIGSAWGSMAIMIPISIQMLASFATGNTLIPVASVPMIYPLLGAILSGAVTGNHLSPTSDTMVMSARSTGAHHMDHVRTQHTYSFPAVFSTAMTFLLSGILIVSYPVKIVLPICFVFGILLNFRILILRNKLSK